MSSTVENMVRAINKFKITIEAIIKKDKKKGYPKKFPQPLKPF